MALDQLRRLIAPLQTRIANMVARAVLQRVDDSTRLQLVQLGILEDETRGGLERFQEYGFTSVPLQGAEAVVVFAGGRRDHGLVVATDDRRYRLKGLQPGEVAIYDQHGSTVVLKANGDVEITPASGAVRVVGDVLAGPISLKNHTHTVALTDSAGDTVSGSTGKPS